MLAGSPAGVKPVRPASATVVTRAASTGRTVNATLGLPLAHVAVRSRVRRGGVVEIRGHVPSSAVTAQAGAVRVVGRSDIYVAAASLIASFRALAAVARGVRPR